MSNKILIDQRHTAVSATLTNPLTVPRMRRSVKPRRPTPVQLHLPLSTSNYWQQTCCWCNLASITNCVQYHRGQWPSGGLESVWGETAIWYLAGKGQQPHDSAYFWEPTLRSVGMLEANELPGGSFPQSYRNHHLEFNSWSFNSRKPDDWGQRWQEFKNYVESVLWGTREPGLDPRPVVLAWHHTRLITGSDGTNVYINDPGGAQYFVFPWESLRQEVIDKIASQTDEEVQNQGYGTLIFLASPRPEEERRGALWLLEHTENVQGALVLRRGGNIMATWHWGGDAGHLDGYYFDGGDLPEHQRFGCSFPIQQGDCLEYQFYIQNTSFETYSYTVKVELLRGASPEELWPVTGPIYYGEVELSGRPHGPDESKTLTQQGPYIGSFDAGNLLGGEYTLKFTLYQHSNVQDVKYLSFAVVGYYQYAVSREHFDKHAAELQAQGYRLAEINAYVSPGATDAAWNGIWVKSGKEWKAVWGWAREDFDKHAAELQAQGYRLAKINAYVSPGATDAAWNGIWVKSGEEWTAVWGWARKDFDQHASELSAQGYRLTQINAYVPPGAADAAWNGIWEKIIPVAVQGQMPNKTEAQAGQLPSSFKSAEELQQRIREDAYFRWEAKGRELWRALDDWLEAERQIPD